MTLHYNPEQQKKENMNNLRYMMKGFDDEKGGAGDDDVEN